MRYGIDMGATKRTALVIYDTRYGNCQRIAGMLVKALHDFDSIDSERIGMPGFTQQKVIDARPDLIIFGAPIHGGKWSWAMRRWVKRFDKILAKHDAKASHGSDWKPSVAIFYTHLDNTPIPALELHLRKFIYGTSLEPKACKTFFNISVTQVDGKPSDLPNSTQKDIDEFARLIQQFVIKSCQDNK